jgi:short-subunit dehydrogenase
MQKNLLPNTQDKKVFITGASSGIGYALCEEYLKQGWSVIGLARDSSKIPGTTKKNNNFKFVKVDLSDFEISKSVINDVLKKNKNINTFILNAGVYLPDGFDNFSFENAKKTFNTNVLSIYLTLELINKNFKLSSKHTLAIMSSTAGYKGLPKSLLYGPSKAALINLAESIKSENSNDLNIKLICPGFVETPATKVNTFKMPFLMSPSKAAEIIFDKIYKKGFEITFPFPFNSIMKFGKILPYKLYFKFTEKKFSKK